MIRLIFIGIYPPSRPSVCVVRKSRELRQDWTLIYAAGAAVRRAVSEVHKYEMLTRDKLDDTTVNCSFIHTYIFIQKNYLA